MACDARSSRYGHKSSNERTSKCPTLIGIAPQRGVQFDALIALVRARRPQSIWHLHKARSRVATHIRVSNSGINAISLPRGVGTCYREKGEGRAFDEKECELVHRTTPLCVSFMKSLARQLHLQIVPSLLARPSSQPVGQKKASKQYSENCQSNNQCDSDNIILRRKRKPIHQHSQFSHCI